MNVAVLTANTESRLSDAADITLCIPVDKVEKSVQPGGNLFEQSLLICTDGIIIRIMNNLNIKEAVMDYNHTNLE